MADYRVKMNSYNVRLNQNQPHIAAQQRKTAPSALSNLSDVEIENLAQSDDHVLAYDADSGKYRLVPAEELVATDQVVQIVQNNLDRDIDGGLF